MHEYLYFSWLVAAQFVPEIARSSLHVCKLVRYLMDLFSWVLILKRNVHCQEFKRQQKLQNRRNELRMTENEKVFFKKLER